MDQGAWEDGADSFPEYGQMKPEQLKIAQLREVAKLKAERDMKFAFIAATGSNAAQ